MKTSIWKRFLSLLLVIALIVPTLLNVVPEDMQLGVTANAATVDVGSLKAGQAGMLVSGVYEIYVPGTQFAIGTNSTGSNAPLYLKDTSNTAYDRSFMRWVIEYGGQWTDTDGTLTHWYTIRHMASGRVVRQGGVVDEDKTNNYFDKLVEGNTADSYSKWQLLYNEESGHYSIRNWGHSIETAENWADGYMVPIEKNANNWNYIEKDQDYTTGSNLLLLMNAAVSSGFRSLYTAESPDRQTSSICVMF